MNNIETVQLTISPTFGDWTHKDHSFYCFCDADHIFLGDEVINFFSDDMSYIGDNMKPLVICYSDQCSTAPNTSLYRYVERNLNAELVYVSTWTDLVVSILRNPIAIIFHNKMVDPEAGCKQLVDKIKRVCMRMSHKINIGVYIDYENSLELIDEMKSIDIVGIVPNPEHFGIDASVEALRSIMNGKSYWPNDIIACLTRQVNAKQIKNVQKLSDTNKSENVTTSNIKHIDKSKVLNNRLVSSDKTGITLTERQTQIANLICKRGLSNKKVANMLDITESTVKAHVSAILKAYGVRNRTQLVLSANITS